MPDVRLEQRSGRLVSDVDRGPSPLTWLAADEGEGSFVTETIDAAVNGASRSTAGGSARSAAISALRLPELQALASQLGVTGTSKMRKSDLVDAIKARRDGGRARTREPRRTTEVAVTTDTAPVVTAPVVTAPVVTAPTDTAPTDTAPTARASRTRRPARTAPTEVTEPAVSAERSEPILDVRRAVAESRQNILHQNDSHQNDSHHSDSHHTDSRHSGETRDDRAARAIDAVGSVAASTERPERGSRRSGRGVGAPQGETENGSPESGDDRSSRQQDQAQPQQSTQQGNQQQPSQQGNQQRQSPNRPVHQNAGPDDDDERGGRRRRSRDRYRDRDRNKRTRGGRPGGGDSLAGYEEVEVNDDDVLLPVAGILDIKDNYAFVRTSGYLPGDNDVYVAMGQAKKAGLRKGHADRGAARQPREGEVPNPSAGRNSKFNALVRLDSVNGRSPEEAHGRAEFGKLTPLYPQERLRLETEPNILTTRVIDLVSPIGKGQRGLIVSPPKAGKTLVLQAIANAITTNNPEVHLMVVLVDERPEEVTDMQRTVKGEVIASTFD
ncbi:MAG: Rho termination factor N-terminal domain-containing protein, partial [Cellulomonas sp.]|nr:Rho termination factor N-terminal domain-containing protein [Cellulomonas sp.]